MEGSRDEAMRHVRLVAAEFQVHDERTSGKLQDWAVNLAWGGADDLAKSGMMNIFTRADGRALDTGTYDDEKLQRLRKHGEALQRKMRRRMAVHGLNGIHTRSPAPEFYWAVVASLVGSGAVSANVMPRDPMHDRLQEAIERGERSECDPFSSSRNSEPARCGSSARARLRRMSRWRRRWSTCTLACR